MDFWGAFLFLVVAGFLLPRFLSPVIGFAWICLVVYGVYSFTKNKEENIEPIFSKKEMEMIQSMEDWASSVKNDLPMRINKDLTLISVNAKNMSVDYNYIVHLNDWDGSHFLALRNYAKNISCGDKNIKYYMDNGFLYFFKFVDLNGKEITSAVFNKNYCG